MVEIGRREKRRLRVRRDAGRRGRTEMGYERLSARISVCLVHMGSSV
jgi:hypothetical protein